MRALICCAVLALAGNAWATEYFVDFDGPCDDSNPGTDRDLPWCSIPGTRTKTDNDFISTDWGAISTATRVAAGDTIWLKGGTTWSAGDRGGTGGRIVLGYLSPSTYYGSGTAQSPIQIRNGAGHSVPFGSGAVTIDCAGMTVPDFTGCVQLTRTTG